MMASKPGILEKGFIFIFGPKLCILQEQRGSLYAWVCFFRFSASKMVKRKGWWCLDQIIVHSVFTFWFTDGSSSTQTRGGSFEIRFNVQPPIMHCWSHCFLRWSYTFEHLQLNRSLACCDGVRPAAPYVLQFLLQVPGFWYFIPETQGNTKVYFGNYSEKCQELLEASQT